MRTSGVRLLAKSSRICRASRLSIYRAARPKGPHLYAFGSRNSRDLDGAVKPSPRNNAPEGCAILARGAEHLLSFENKRDLADLFANSALGRKLLQAEQARNRRS